MAEYIEREAAISQFEYSSSAIPEKWAQIRIEELPAADVVPVRHGRWENGHCTRCGEDVASRLDIWTNVQRFLYCPFCGALMDEDGDGDA